MGCIIFTKPQSSTHLRLKDSVGLTAPEGPCAAAVHCGSLQCLNCQGMTEGERRPGTECLWDNQSRTNVRCPAE